MNRRSALPFSPGAYTNYWLQMDDLIQERVTQKENELNATYDEKMRNYEIGRAHV